MMSEAVVALEGAANDREQNLKRLVRRRFGGRNTGPRDSLERSPSTPTARTELPASLIWLRAFVKPTGAAGHTSGQS
jgi:hypothetical protein